MKKAIADLKVGDAFQFGRIHDEPIIWLVGEHGHKGSPKETTAIVTKGTIGNITFAPADPLDRVHDRRLYGSNRYQDSYVRKYISEHDNLIFNEEEFSAIAETCIQTRIPEIDGGGVDSFLDRLFLLSASEVGLEEEDVEGSVIELFKNRDFRRARDIDGDMDWWWLRSAIVSYSSYVRFVHTVGSASGSDAYSGSRGCVPLVIFNLIIRYPS